MRPDVARDVLLATHGGLSLELCAVIGHISPMALYRLICALGQQSLGCVLPRCGLPLPVYFLADEKHSRAVSRRRCICPRLSVAVCSGISATPRSRVQQRCNPTVRSNVPRCSRSPRIASREVLIDGFDSTTKSLRTLFPGARLGTCLRHALLKLPKKLVAIASPVRKPLRSQFHTLLYRARQRKGLRVFALGQRLRRFADRVAHIAGETNGERVRRWFQEKGRLVWCLQTLGCPSRARCWIRPITPSSGSCSR